MVHVELEVDDLPEFIFLRNRFNKPIELHLNGIQDTTDLFCFCVDLLCKGLFYCCAHKSENGGVDIESITEEEFNIVVTRLGHAGININMKVEPNEYNIPSTIDMGDTYRSKSSNKLEDYIFKLVSPSKIFQISFAVIRATV